MTAGPMAEQSAQSASRFRLQVSPYLTALFLFVVALLPRLPGLDRFLTSDENTNIFFAGSDVVAAFLQGDWRGTYWHFYPGVTMSWLDGLGMAGQYLLDVVSGQPVPPFTDYIYGDILSLVVANRLPYAILTAAAVPALYLLACRLLPKRVALLGALLVAFDPFYLAHSRVAHGDAPVAVFMSLSALAFFIYGERVTGSTGQPKSLTSFIWQRTSIYLLLSAAFGSLAALTKAPGQFMALFVMGMAIIYAGLEWRQTATEPTSRIMLRWLLVVISWGLISLAIFVLLWPSMWVDPVGTFRQMWDETFGKVDEGHLVYFLGSPTLNPGPWFYLYVIPFRMTPVVLVGSLLSLLIFIPGVSARLKLQEPERRAVLFLWLFTISLLLFGNLSPKKQDRYLLPLFPFLNFLAAVGWFAVINLMIQLLTSHTVRLKSRYMYLIATAVTMILLLFHLWPTFSYYPYYLTYFNPLMGGPTRAAKTTLMGWGEGMEQAAAYLNSKPDAASLYVASTPSQTLLPYFAGTGENFYTNDIALRADYIVLYLAQMQRKAPSPEIVAYFEAQPPEKVITIQAVPYAKIYPGPKLILPDIPPGATPINIGLEDMIRLAGFTVPISELRQGHCRGPQTLELTLYWHALAPMSANYTVSVRTRAADGRLLVQQDSWPVDGLLPTSQWRQGDYVTDTHLLEISPADLHQITSIELVLYNAETGETMGPPISLPINDQ